MSDLDVQAVVKIQSPLIAATVVVINISVTEVVAVGSAEIASTVIREVRQEAIVSR